MSSLPTKECLGFSPPKPGSRSQHLRRYFNDQLAPDALLETELIILALAVGINDATTFPDYRIFASNQTGNTALLAVGALGLVPESVNLNDIGFSLGMFALGGVCLGQLGHYFGRTRRSWLLINNIFQTILVFAAAALRKWVAISQDKPSHYSVITLLAFASGGQVATARTVNVPEITTAMVTSAYIDLLADPNLLVKDNRPRNRRALFVVALLVGSFIGAVAYKTVEPAFSYFLAGLAKLSICMLLFFNQDSTPRAEAEDAQ